MGNYTGLPEKFTGNFPKKIVGARLKNVKYFPQILNFRTHQIRLQEHCTTSTRGAFSSVRCHCSPFGVVRK